MRQELHTFLDHYNYQLQGRRSLEVEHPLMELYNITPHPIVFSGFLWRYRITIARSGVLEDYRLIVQTDHTPQGTKLQRAYSVFYAFDSESYMVTLTA
jgi:hypothetical protein